MTVVPTLAPLSTATVEGRALSLDRAVDLAVTGTPAGPPLSARGPKLTARTGEPGTSSASAPGVPTWPETAASPSLPPCSPA
ncbi:hypothetical protein [Actinoplanes sp. TFC3]|uniref:hypothetical protein n=1 Tax=Actinoplanes sp. TFC3 TaxID=1710355 RepID=UPI00082EA772|nr:hypothetical protein [Actinoplanes sp. TFC3]